MRKWMLLLIVLEILVFTSVSLAQVPVDISSIPVDCSFTNMEAPLAFSELSKQTRVDISVDPAVVGKINLVGKMTFGEAIDIICTKTNSLSARSGEKSLIISSLNPKGPYFAAISQTVFLPGRFLDVKQIMTLFSNTPYSQYMTAEETSNIISVTAPQPIIDTIKAKLAEVDIEPTRMGYQFSVVDTTNSTLKDAGFQALLKDLIADSNGVYSISWQNQILGFTSPYATITALHYLASNNVKILSQPTGIVACGQTLYLYFGTEQTIVTVILSGSTVPSGLTAVKTGTEITVTSWFIPPNKFKLHIKGDVSQPVATFSSGNIATSVLRRSFEETTFVTDGETVFIGGLASQLDTITRSKVPFLGDLPLIGNLFRSKHHEISNQEISIIFTPRLIKPGEVLPSAEYVIKKTSKEAEKRTPEIEGQKTPSITTEKK